MSLLLLLGGQSAASAASATMPAVQVVIAGVGDVGDDYHLVQTVRGRNRELDEFQAGTGMVTLLDRARKYDPANTASPYYPNIRPMAGVQILATWDGTTYPLFTGTIDSVESVYAGPLEGDAETTLYLTDGFKALQAGDLASSAYAQEVAADGPAHWWRLGEPTSTAGFFDAVGGRHMTAVGTHESADALVSRDDNGAQFTEDNTGGGYTELQSPGDVTAVTAELIFSMDNNTIGHTFSEATPTLTAAWTGSISEVSLGVHKARFDVRTTAGTISVETSSTDLSQSGAHHLALTWDGATVRLYLNGVLEDSEPLGGTMFTTADSTYILFGGAIVGPFSTFGLIGGTYDELVIYRSALSAERIAAHVAARTTPWDGDTPGERIARVLDAVEWPEERRDLDEGNVTLQPAELAETALEHAQKAAASDFGALFITAGGDVRFIGREGLFNRPQLFTFGDGGGAELGYVSLRPELTDQLIANDITISRLDGTAQRVTDETSVATYLRHSLVLDGLLFDDDTFALGAAQFLLSERKDPLRRVSNLVVAPRGAPSSLYPAVLGLELLDQITVIDRPPGGGAANTQDTSIEGISHTITPLGWETAWNLAPSLGAQGDPGVVWQLGTAGYSELGVTTRLAF